MKKIDLHTHTNMSDGQLSPKLLVDAAIQAKLAAIAITDHDTVAACAQAKSYAKKSVEVISGIEISCYEKEFGFVEVHALGLYIDYKNKNLTSFCKSIQTERINQKKKIIQKLNSFGYDITFEEAVKHTGYSFGRPHIARILVEKYPKEFSTVRSVFDAYLAEGKPAFVPRKEKTQLKQAINLIQRARGVAILAHPGIYEKKKGILVINHFLDKGGQGIETYYPYSAINSLSVNESQNLNRYFQEYAKKHQLLQSGGSDFHGDIRKTVSLGQGNVPYALVEEIRSYLNR